MGRPAAVLFDRDGTLIHDEPACTHDHSLLRPVAGARAAVARLRREGVPVGVVTNQAAIGRGWATRAQVDALNRVIDAAVGPFDTWQLCPHRPDEGCECRKPRPGMVRAAAAQLKVPCDQVVVIGDIESDVLAAQAAGATGILVPTGRTRPQEVARARHRAPDLSRAVDLALAVL
jgi:histidinol-phosphate phosphatase family protein